MSKLTGVTALSDAKRISWNSQTFIESNEKAVAGDIVVAVRKCMDIAGGDYFQVESRLDGELFFRDNAGDRRYKSLKTGREVIVFKPVAAGSANDVVTVNGFQYRKLTRPAVVGDSVLALESGLDIRQGAVYVITGIDDDDDLEFVDDAGDESCFERDECVVVERVDGSPIAAPTTEPAKTLALSDDYHVTNKAVFRKVKRTAKVGERILIVNAVTSYDKYANGDILTVDELAGSFAVGVYVKSVAAPGNTNGYIMEAEYVVLEPVKSVVIDGTEYTLECRSAKVGETVLTVENFCYGKIGDISVITRSGYGDVTTSKSQLMNHGRYVVLTPTSTGKYVEVKRRAQVGDRIRILAPYMSSGRYNIGDEFTVSSVDSEGDIYVDIDGKSRLIVSKEFVVLESVTTPPSSRPFQPGDVVKTNYSGELLTLKEREPKFDGASHGKAWRLTKGTWLGENQFTLATPAPAPAPEKPLAVGDFVKVIGGNNRGTKIGDIVRIREIYTDGDFRIKDLRGNEISGFKMRQNVVRATIAEINFAFVAAVNTGDSVRITGNRNDCGVENGIGHFHDIGTIATVMYVASEHISAENSGKHQSISHGHYEIVKSDQSVKSDSTVKPTQPSTPTNPTVKIGDKIRVTGNGTDNIGGRHCYKNGDILTVSDVKVDRVHAAKDGGLRQSLSYGNFELVVEPAERELQVGDVVKYIGGVSTHGLNGYESIITTIDRIVAGGEYKYHLAKPAYVKSACDTWTKAECIQLVAPAKSTVTAK